MDSPHDAYAQEKARSFRNLTAAREKASEKSGYDSLRTRIETTTTFRSRFGQDPYEWQLDAAEAVILGLDTVVIAGTSSGKTIPFLLPLLLDKKKKAIVISPLKVLQEEQVCEAYTLLSFSVLINAPSGSEVRKTGCSLCSYQW